MIIICGEEHILIRSGLIHSESRYLSIMTNQLFLERFLIPTSLHPDFLFSYSPILRPLGNRLSYGGNIICTSSANYENLSIF